MQSEFESTMPNDESSSDESSSNADFSILPANLHEQVLKSLALTERMNIRLVNRRWNDVALSSVQLNLQIDAEEFNVDGGVIKAAFSLTKATPTKGPTIEHPEMASLSDVWQLPWPLMQRCFQIHLALGSGCNAPAGLLSRIDAQISRTCKLSLATVDLPVNVFSISTRPRITFAEEFPGLQLHSLSLASELDGSSSGNNELISYFRTDCGINYCKSIELAVRSPISNNTMAIIVEHYPQATELHLDLCSQVHGSDSIEPPTNADWLILSRLAKLRKLKILIDGETTVKLPELHFPQLVALGCQNVILSPETDFRVLLPHLERLELKRTDDGNCTTEVKSIALAIRAGQLKNLAVAKFMYREALPSASLECMQLLLKAILDSGSTVFRRLCWHKIDIDELMFPPCLIQLLNGLPEGCFRQRPLEIMVTDSDILLYTQLGLNDYIAERVPKIVNAMTRSGLRQLTLGVEFTDDHLLEDLIDMLNRAATDLGPEFHVECVRRVPEDANIEDHFDLRESFTPPVLRPLSVVLRIRWEANGQQQKLELVDI